MKVTEEEMELLKVVLNGLTSTGPAIQLVNMWRQRGVEPSEFELKEKSSLSLSSSSPPPLSLHSLSSSVTPSLSNPPQGDARGLLKKKNKKELSVDLILEAVPPDLSLRSGRFLKAWKEWIENRLELPNATLRAFSGHMRTCARLGESRAIAAIEHSIASSYRAIFEPYSGRQTKPDDRDRIGASL
jgi:hypothetical protein